MRKFLSVHLISVIATLALIALATASRLVPHAPNITLTFGIAIFSGFSFQRNKLLSFLVPLTSLLLSDSVLGFHSYMWGTYLGTLIAISLGLAASHRSANTHLFSSKLFGLAGASFVSSITFYLISNFHVWIGSGADSLYPKTLAGLIECYIAALPFLKNSLVADSGTAIALLTLSELASKFLSSHKLEATVSSQTA